MYAITFDLDTAILENAYPNPSWENAYQDIRKYLEEVGFTRAQGTVYFGNNQMDGVKCILAVQEMSVTFDWFRSSVRNIRMLRIEESSDLMPAIESYERLISAKRARTAKMRPSARISDQPAAAHF